MSRLPFKAALLASTAAVFAFSAHAQDYYGAIGLSYNTTSVDTGFSDIDADTLSLDGTVHIDFGNGFSMNADVSHNRSDIDLSSTTLKTTVFALDGKYRFSSGVTLGGYVQQIGLDAGPTDLDYNSYGVTLGYTTDTWGVETFIGKTETSEDFAVDADDYGVLAYYKPSDSLSIGGGVIRTEVDDDFVDQDLTLVRLAGVYDITSSWSVFGGVDRLSNDGFDVTTTGIGVGYDLAQLVGRSTILSLELSRTDVETADFDTVEIGVTIPLGAGASKVPLSSVAGQILRPKHSAINGITTAGFPAFF